MILIAAPAPATAAMSAAIKRIKAATTRNDETQAAEDHEADNFLEYAHFALLGGKGPANVLNAKPGRTLTGLGRIAVKLK
jgi:hypothetical protein